MKLKSGQAMIGAFVGVLVAVIIFSVIATLIGNQTSTQTTSETLATTANSFTQLGHTNILNATVKVENETVTLPNTQWEMNAADAILGRINVTSAGAINATTGTLTYNYTFEPSGFIPAGTTRTIVNTLLILIALVILTFLGGLVTIGRQR